MQIFVDSLGCKLNQSEMDRLAAQLRQRGHLLVGSADEAEVCVLNTCAVTHVAAQKSRQTLRRLNRDNPQARIVATGCYAELFPDDLGVLPGVEIVAGNREKERLEETIADLTMGASSTRMESRESYSLRPSRTRALVKIQDGCDNACTYCIIHVARGAQRSRRQDEILADVQERLANGHQEIVLTGVHIGAYGRDRNGSQRHGDLWTLVQRILTETNVPRLRLSSIEPWDLEARAFKLWGDARLCPHLHLPLQSGSDAVLRRMGRRYTTSEFAAWAAAARAAIPDLAVTTDIIVGFPGESDAEFEQSADFVRNLGFARIHVFPYSSREGTPAARMENHVSPQVKSERARAMRAVASVTALAFEKQFIGRTMDVLWESSREAEGTVTWSGLTGNYVRVLTQHRGELANTISSTRLVSLAKGGLLGELESKSKGR